MSFRYLSCLEYSLWKLLLYDLSISRGWSMFRYLWISLDFSWEYKARLFIYAFIESDTFGYYCLILLYVYLELVYANQLLFSFVNSHKLETHGLILFNQSVLVHQWDREGLVWKVCDLSFTVDSPSFESLVLLLIVMTWEYEIYTWWNLYLDLVNNYL